jgi:hypothetical protein
MKCFSLFILSFLFCSDIIGSSFREIKDANRFIGQLNKQHVEILKTIEIKQPIDFPATDENDKSLVSINLWDYPRIEYYTYNCMPGEYTQDHSEYIKFDNTITRWRN